MIGQFKVQNQKSKGDSVQRAGAGSCRQRGAASGAIDEVRADHQSEDDEEHRRDDSAIRARACG
jgi:hypothetical protein